MQRSPRHTRLIFDLQYFGNLNYYKYLLTNSHVAFNAYDRHQKKSFSNRCVIAGANGPILLSVPLKDGRLQKTPFNKIQISPAENWQKKHWRAILSSYNASPWFVHYRDSLSDVYSRPFDLLIDWNLSCLEWAIRQLRLTLDYELLTENNHQDLEKIVAHWNDPDTAASDSPIRYQQVFESRTGFIPNLSILDLLFCVGPRMSVALLKSGNLNQCIE